MRASGALFLVVLFGICSRASADDFQSTTTTAPTSHNDGLLGATSTDNNGDANETYRELGDTVAEAPGTRVRATGGPGAPSWISIRASTPWQVGVFLDGIALHGADETSFDIASIPATMIREVVVYRSSIPVTLGSALPGGAIELRTRFDAESGEQIAATGGSFATRRLSLAIQRRHANVDWLLAANYFGTNGRFRYFDTNGTTFNRQDDRTLFRSNAASDRGDAMMRIRARAGRWRVTTLALGGASYSGVPGQVGATADEAALGRGNIRVVATADRRVGDKLSLRVLSAAAYSTTRFDDPASELGFGAQRRRDTVFRGSASLQPHVSPGPRLDIAGVAEVSVESLEASDALDDAGGVAALRTNAALGVEFVAGVVPRWLSARIGARADLVVDDVRKATLVNDSAEAPVSVLPGVSLGTRSVLLEMPHWRLDVRSEFSMAGRTPSFVERYGDRGVFVGNPALREESRVGGELGVTVALAEVLNQLAIETAAYVRETSDQIVWVENGVGVASPRNLDRVFAIGVEWSARYSWRELLDVDATYTYIDARDRSGDAATDGERVPWQPSQWVSGRIGVSPGDFALHADIEHSGPFAVDRLGERVVPQRTMLGAGVRWSPRFVAGLSLDVRVENMLDLRQQDVAVTDGGREVMVPRAIADYTAMPLPGRAAWVTLAWRRGTD